MFETHNVHPDISGNIILSLGIYFSQQLTPLPLSPSHPPPLKKNPKVLIDS